MRAWYASIAANALINSALKFHQLLGKFSKQIIKPNNLDVWKIKFQNLSTTR